ncbi:MAG: hypothetical protein WB239_15050 [Acidimicrobiia bacterium]
MSGSTWLIAGSGLFLVGAAIGVPRVFMTTDAEERLRLLTERVVLWRVAQVLYSLGPVLTAIGVVEYGLALGAGVGLLLVSGGTAMVVGSLLWSYSCWLRGLDPVGWNQGKQPGWPFRSYVLLTLAGLAALGLALLLADSPTWLGWVVLAADLGYLILFVATDDIPPFVFYVLLILVGIAY